MFLVLGVGRLEGLLLDGAVELLLEARLFACELEEEQRKLVTHFRESVPEAAEVYRLDGLREEEENEEEEVVVKTGLEMRLRDRKESAPAAQITRPRKQFSMPTVP